MKKIRLAIIGAGFNGQISFIQNFFNNRKCILLGIVEARNSLRNLVAKKYNIPNQYPSHNDLKKDMHKYDALVIITKRSMTPAIASEFFKFGKPIFTEKPMASTYVHAQKLVRQARKFNVLYKIGYNKIHDEGISKAKLVFENLLRSKKFGKIILIRSHRVSGSGYDIKNKFISTSENNYLSQPSWNECPDWLPLKYLVSYKKYLNLFCHNISLIRHFVSQQPKVAFADISEKKISTVLLDYKSFSAILETGFFTKNGWDETFNIYFEKGSLNIYLPPQHFKNQSATFELYSNEKGKIIKFKKLDSWSFKRQADSFITEILGNKIIYNNAFDAMYDIKLIENIWKKFLKKT